MLLAFEGAESAAGPTDRAAHLTFVVVGARSIGIELAGATGTTAIWPP